jgi:hypothetical protein
MIPGTREEAFFEKYTDSDLDSDDVPLSKRCKKSKEEYVSDQEEELAWLNANQQLKSKHKESEPRTTSSTELASDFRVGNVNYAEEDTPRKRGRTSTTTGSTIHKVTFNDVYLTNRQLEAAVAPLHNSGILEIPSTQNALTFETVTEYRAHFSAAALQRQVLPKFRDQSVHTDGTTLVQKLPS